MVGYYTYFAGQKSQPVENAALWAVDTDTLWGVLMYELTTNRGGRAKRILKIMREIPWWCHSIVHLMLVQKVLGWQSAWCWTTKLCRAWDGVEVISRQPNGFSPSLVRFIILPKTSSCLYRQLRISCLQSPNDNVVEDASNL